MISQDIAYLLNCLNAFTPVNARNGADTDVKHTTKSASVGENKDNDKVDGEKDDTIVNLDEEEEQEDEQIEMEKVPQVGTIKMKPMKEL